MRTLIKGGTIVTAEQEFHGDILVEGETIRAIGTDLGQDADYILDASGRILGRHEGVCYYTVGQRRGLGVPSDGRKYVAALDAENNTVVLDEKEALETATVYLRDVVLHLPLPDEGITAKIRYRDQDTPVEVELLEGNRAILHFEQPKFAPAPGQSAVFYWENCLLGGGVIERGGREQ